MTDSPGARLEQLAFNSLPAALWPDVTANVYHHRSNQLSCGGQYGYNLFYCCTSNVHQGWPYFVLGQVHTTSNGTVVVAAGESAIKYKSPLNVLKGTYDHSCC